MINKKTRKSTGQPKIDAWFSSDQEEVPFELRKVLKATRTHFSPPSQIILIIFLRGCLVKRIYLHVC
jgi:hypothetical protein